MRLLMLAVVLAATLHACGFSMRTAAPLPESMGSVAIDAIDLDSPLVRDLEAELAAAGASVKGLNQPASSLLKIVSETNERHVVSLDDRAKVGEYELHYRVIYAVQAADGSEILKDTPIELSRVYSFDEQQAIGAAQEEETIRAELRRDAVRVIMERLQRIQDPNRAKESRESAVE